MSEVILSGPAGRLEGRYRPGSSESSSSALFLHPHPRRGGTMNNKLIYSLFSLFSERGFSCMRMNFRGVGRSEGGFEKDEDQLEDAATALDWLQQNQPHGQDFWVIGFSFGAWIAMQLLMRRPEIRRFIAIAPPVDEHDFSFLVPCPAPGLIMHGLQDEYNDPEKVEEFVKKLKQQKRNDVTYRPLPDADHSLTYHLEEVVSEIDSYLEAHFTPPPPMDEF